MVDASTMEDDKTEGSMKSYFRLFTYNDTTGWITTAIAVVCAMATGVLMPLMNLVFGRFVTVFNDFFTGRTTEDELRKSLNHYSLYFVYLFVAKFVLLYTWTTLLSINAIRITRFLRVDFLKSTLRQEISFFDHSSQKSALAARLHADANLAHQGIAEKSGLVVQAMTTFMAAFIVALVAQWKLALITLSVVPAILLGITVAATPDMALEKRCRQHWAVADRLAEDVLASIRSVHAFWAFGRLEERYQIQLERAHAVGRRTKPPLHAILFCTQFFCIYAGYGLAFWKGVHMYHWGEIHEPGKIVTVIFAVMLAVNSLTQIAPQIMVVSKSATAAHSLFQTIDRPSKIDSLSNDGIIPQQCHGDLVFRNVDFAYPSRPDVPVMNNFNLVIPANKTTAIVGPSGTGKSTIVALLERWYEPSSGSITLDGRPIEDLNLRWLRTTMRLVQQEPVLFSGSIAENVAHGLPESSSLIPASEKQHLVEAACRAADCDGFVRRLPEGYSTLLGEGGAMLSGGQRQRLVLARCLISNPRVLLLDEATSALDPVAEKTVQKALQSVAADRTVVVIAHRLATVRSADNIVVLGRDGSVVEQGTHAALVAAQGAYARLVEAQDLGNAKVGRYDPEMNEEEEEVDSGKLVPQTKQDGKTSIDEKPTNYSLIKCLAIIIREQKPLHIPFAILALSACVVGGIYPAFAVLFSHVIRVFALSGQELLRQGDFYALMFFVLACGNLVAYCILGWMSATISQAIAHNYRASLFSALLRQPMSFYDHPDHGAGTLAACLASEPEALQELLSSNIALMLTICVNLLASCLLALATGWKLGCVLVFGALPPLVLAGYVRMVLERRLDDATASRFASSAGRAAEAVRSIRIVASLALEPTVVSRYADDLQPLARQSVRSLATTMVWYALSQSLTFLVLALGFWYGGRLLASSEYSMAQFYTVFIAAFFSGEAASGFFTYTSSLTQAQRAANCIFTLRNQVPEYLRDNNSKSVEKHDKDDTTQSVKKPSNDDATGIDFDFQDLAFSYPRRPDVPVLQKLSLSVRPGQFVALVGASGCGKTTVISLLERFYDPTAGVLRFGGGVDIRDTPVRSSRRQMALVQQEPVLYHGTIRDNLVLGADDAIDSSTISDDDLLTACRQAHISDFVLSLPDGLHTDCGSQGLPQFSGGQRQRLALARALVRRPRLLLLDEATSNLDSESERQVQAALEASSATAGLGQRTTVAVAHRLATVQRADAIFVLDRGHIVEVGRHEELLAKRGLYYEMCLGQSLDQ